MNYALRMFVSRPVQCCGYAVRHVASKPSNSVTEDSASTKPAAKSYEQPLYATKAQYRAGMQNHRTSSNFDESTGVKPTKWQRRFLVITNLYRRVSEIPEYISSGTMQRMHNRMRVVFIVVACTIFYIFFFVIERGCARVIINDKSSGITFACFLMMALGAETLNE